MPVFELPSGSELTESGDVPAEQTDHVAAAMRRLPSQWRGKPNIEALLAILVEPAQELEDVLWTLVYYRTLDKAVELGLDAVIDQIGKLVGEPRGGKSNEDYARFINARITARKSNGLIEEVITVTRLIINEPDAYVHLKREGIATLRVTIEDVAIADDVAAILIEFLKVTVSTGVHVYLEWGTEEVPFTWDTEGMGWDEGSFVDATDGL